LRHQNRPADPPDAGHPDKVRAAGGPTRAIVILPDARRQSDNPAGTAQVVRSQEARLEEAVGLARAIGLDVVEALIVPLRRPVPATLFGSGKVEEIAAMQRIHEAGLVIVDHPVSPVQQRNLEKAWNTKVLDRTGLILEIFGDRARTREGRLQVELAHLNYQRSRLVRSWTHLERQRGGFGFLGGPGETQIEADRRQIQTRIKQIEGLLEKVSTRRSVHRAERKRTGHPVVALVGYTNAGKSTLFNRLTGADVVAKDMVFATLDPTLRSVSLPHGAEMIVSDTVGFISELPTTLVAAFRATLEEVLEADLILHVRDIATPETEREAEDVMGVLGELGIVPGEGFAVLEAWNKIDRLDAEMREVVTRRAAASVPPAVPVSALTGEGVDTLLLAIEKQLMGTRPTLGVVLDPDHLAAVPWLYKNTEVLARSDDPRTGRTRITVRVPEARMAHFRQWAQASDATVATVENL
jgi:GTP-binding protein HflX